MSVEMYGYKKAVDFDVIRDQLEIALGVEQNVYNVGDDGTIVINNGTDTRLNEPNFKTVSELKNDLPRVRV